MTQEQMLIAAVIALAGVVTFLYGKLNLKDKAQQAELEECKKDRLTLWQTLARNGLEIPEEKREQ